MLLQEHCFSLAYKSACFANMLLLKHIFQPKIILNI